VTLWQALLLVLAGLGAGLTGSVAGLASVISYPALLAVGLSPLTANVTNSVALVSSSVGSVAGSKPELVGQRTRAGRLGLVFVAGGILGSILLLTTPTSVFERIVPWLVGLGAIAVLVVRRPTRLADTPHHTDSRAVLLAVFLIGVYSGYFGAAAGVLLLALLLFATSDTLPRCNALKNLITGLSNGVAAIVFVLFGSVSWSAAVPLAIGLFVGGRIGPHVVRHAPVRLLRVVIALAGLGLAVHLGLNAYR
jgi:uncharacterized membrane protein YfcA